MLPRTASLLVAPLMGLSLCLTAASGQELDEVGGGTAGSPCASGISPTRFHLKVLASAAGSGKFLDVSAYLGRRCRRDESERCRSALIPNHVDPACNHDSRAR